MNVLMIGPANLGPYHFARFRAVAKKFPNFAYVTVLARDSYRPWASDIGDPPCRIINLEQNGKVCDLLHAENPKVLITVAYSNWAVLRAARWAKRNGVLSVVYSVSTHLDHPRRRWKEFAKAFIVRRSYDAAFVTGSRAAEYIESLGISKNAIYLGGNAVDNKYFAVSNQTWQPPDMFPQKYFLTVSRLSPEKNIPTLLQAYKEYYKKGGNWGLVIAGTGPSEETLRESVPPELIDRVHWFGWASYEDLPSFYHGASCFILPSISEPWGLVVNEAMAAGLPILVSNRCGCLPELCRSGVNGYSFDPYDIDGLAELMFKMSCGLMDFINMGEASKNLIARFTPENWALALYDCILSMISRISTKLS